MNDSVSFSNYLITKKLTKLKNTLRGRKRMITSSLFKTSVLFFAVISLFLVIGLSFFTQVVLGKYNQYLSKPSLMLAFKSNAVTFLDRNGAVIYRTPGRYNTAVVPLNSMPKSLINATLAAEDKDFYHHKGFSMTSTARALFNDAKSFNLYHQGGSTITQQLARNFFLSSDKTFWRKLKELVLSVGLERKYSKNEILELYLNSVYYGAGAYGAPQAAKIYFNKDVADLTLAESSFLAGLPASPTNLSPITGSKEQALERQKYVLDQMAKDSFISRKEKEMASFEQLSIQTSLPAITNAPHFVLYLKQQMKDILPNMDLDNSGLTIHTTLDMSLQKKAEDLISERVAALKYRNVTNGAFYSVNPTTGEILTMVGSVNFNQPDWGTVNVLTSPRSPGSAIKPIIYATALTNGKITLGTVLDDQPTKYQDPITGEVYTPTDSDNKFRGKVLPREALANSLNIPAVQVLAKTGLASALDGAEKMGITGLGSTTNYGMSFTLGGVELKGIDLATAYGVLANGGDLIRPWGIGSIEDRFGKVIYKEKPEKKQVLDPKVAYLITNVLSDTKARELLFGPHNALELDRPAAAKTGTAQDFKNAWAVGYTPHLLSMAWFGNNDGSPMNNIWGLESAAPVWHNFMQFALKGSPKENFVQPADIKTASICKLDGSQAAPNQPSANELFITGTEPKSFGACMFLAKKEEDDRKAAEDAAKSLEEILKHAFDQNGIGGPGNLPPGQEKKQPPDQSPPQDSQQVPL